MASGPCGSRSRAPTSYFTITDASAKPRRQIVSAAKCMVCHRSDGTGAAPQLTLHGANRTEEPQVCIVCHNPNNTDIPFRLATDPKPLVGRYVYPEQSLDFKTLVHGIHASTTGFREDPLVVIAFNHTVFDASTLVKFPGELRNCVTCHIDNRTKGTFELPLSPDVTRVDVRHEEHQRQRSRHDRHRPDQRRQGQPDGRRLFVVPRRGRGNRSHGPSRRSVIPHDAGGARQPSSRGALCHVPRSGQEDVRAQGARNQVAERLRAPACGHPAKAGPARGRPCRPPCARCGK